MRVGTRDCEKGRDEEGGKDENDAELSAKKSRPIKDARRTSRSLASTNVLGLSTMDCLGHFLTKMSSTLNIFLLSS